MGLTWFVFELPVVRKYLTYLIIIWLVESPIFHVLAWEWRGNYCSRWLEALTSCPSSSNCRPCHTYIRVRVGIEQVLLVGKSLLRRSTSLMMLQPKTYFWPQVGSTRTRSYHSSIFELFLNCIWSFLSIDSWAWFGSLHTWFWPLLLISSHQLCWFRQTTFLTLSVFQLVKTAQNGCIWSLFARDRLEIW